MSIISFMSFLLYRPGKSFFALSTDGSRGGNEGKEEYDEMEMDEWYWLVGRIIVVRGVLIHKKEYNRRKESMIIPI